jgi:signal transduction histidine kinase
VLVSYMVLIVFSTLFSLLTIRHILIVRLEHEIDKSLVQEVEEFRRLIKGRDPKTGKLFGKDVAAIFDVYLRRNVPNNDEFLLTILDGQLYKSSPIGLPDSLRPDAVVKRWGQLTQPEQNEITIASDTIRYLAYPVKIEEEIRGVFVVAYLTASKYEEVDRVIVIVGIVEGIMASIALTSSIVYLAAGRILTRLRLLTETARQISSSDLSQRIPVQGKDEITELTITVNEMLVRLQAAFNSQQEFINDASHELRTPITIVSCYLQQLKVDDEQEETRTSIEDELQRMNRLVNDLLLLTKAERPDFLNPEIVEISSLTQELYLKASTLAERNWCLQAKGSGRLIADRQRLTQAVLNLAQNATQHTTEGDVIALGSTLTNGLFRFWVCDTGEGIAIEEQERIFQRFARGSGGRRSEGAGLGLAIVQAIAQAHGGWVELSSQPECGSIFTLVIPLDPSQKNSPL